MNPSYKLQIDLYIGMPIDADSVWMRRIGYLPFVPRTGDTLRLSQNDDEDQQVDLTLDEVVWDVSAGTFVATVTDNSVIEAYSNGELTGPTLRDTVEEYKKIDFLRLNFPQAQAIR